MSAGSSKMQRTVEQGEARFLREAMAKRIQRLRDLADRIESETAQDLKRAEAGKGTYATVVANYANTLAYGVANQHLSTLISVASEADIAHAKGE